MDNAEIASNCSYNSDSLQSSLSGLSLYQDEYTELVHLVNPTRYQNCEGDVRQLVKRNQQLEAELVQANKHINRLVNCHNSLEVEKVLQELWASESKLRELNAKLLKEKQELEVECTGLKINLAELDTQKQVNTGLVASLKETVSQHYVQWQQEVKQSASLKLVVSDLTSQLTEAERVKLWYKTQWESTKSQLQSSQTELESLKAENSKLQLKLTETKSELDKVQLETLKEKSQLLQKLERFNLEFAPKEPTINLIPCQNCAETNEEKLKTQLISKNLEIRRMIEENSAIVSKCLVLQKTVQHKESEIEGLDLRQKQTNLKLQKSEQQIQQLKTENATLQVELNCQKADKTMVQQQIEMLQSQFVQFKHNYSVKEDLKEKNKTHLQLEKNKPEADQSEMGTLNGATDDQKVELKHQNYTQELRGRVKELEVLLKVRNRQLTERQLRMDRTNRTLLGKVKEHMKGRNYAEKQLNNLQGEHNTLKLALTDLRLKCNSQDELIQNLRNQCKEEVKLRLELEETVKQVTSKSSDLQQTVERLEETKMAAVHHLKEYQSRLSKLESEKYFFQRLSRDLKVALASYKESNDSFIEKYDQESVRQVLADSKQVASKKVASKEIKLGLDQLRYEICNLQAQIARKSALT